jgi:hypothetical protein
MGIWPDRHEARTGGADQRQPAADLEGCTRLIATGLEAPGARCVSPLHPVEATRAKSKIDASRLNESSTAHVCLEQPDRCREKRSCRPARQRPDRL